MGAMRLFSKEEFEEHLTNSLELESTDETTATGRFWKTSKGFYIHVPDLGNGPYPDYIVHEIYLQLEKIEST